MGQMSPVKDAVLGLGLPGGCVVPVYSSLALGKIYCMWMLCGSEQTCTAVCGNGKQ